MPTCGGRPLAVSSCGLRSGSSTVSCSRRYLARDAENLPHAFLGFAEPLGEDFRAVDRDEVDAALFSNRLRQQCLAGAGGAMQQRADVWRQAARRQHLRIAQRQLDGLLQALLDLIETADVAP